MEAKGTFNIWTSGCQMNEHDSEIMYALLEKEGYSWTSDPETADIVILNTCSVRKTAEQKALGFLGNLKYRKKKGYRLDSCSWWMLDTEPRGKRISA
jgi:tRNA-2-methylthio-N6-dimethylallyladenosine synthase